MSTTIKVEEKIDPLKLFNPNGDAVLSWHHKELTPAQKSVKVHAGISVTMSTSCPFHCVASMYYLTNMQDVMQLYLVLLRVSGNRNLMVIPIVCPSSDSPVYILEFFRFLHASLSHLVSFSPLKITWPLTCLHSWTQFPQSVSVCIEGSFLSLCPDALKLQLCLPAWAWHQSSVCLTCILTQCLPSWTLPFLPKSLVRPSPLHPVHTHTVLEVNLLSYCIMFHTKFDFMVRTDRC